MIFVNGPSSELENEVRKKYIKINELKKIVDSPQNYSKTELERIKNKTHELLQFYDRIIKSINYTLNGIKKNQALSYKEKKDRYIIKQEKELYKAKKEKSQIMKYYNKLIEILKNYK